MPEVIGAEGRGEALPDKAPPVVGPGCEQVRLLLFMRQLHETTVILASGRGKMCKIQWNFSMLKSPLFMSS